MVAACSSGLVYLDKLTRALSSAWLRTQVCIFKMTTDLLMTYLLGYGVNVLGAIITLIVGYRLAGWISRAVDRAVHKSEKIDPVFHPLPGKIVRLDILVFTLIAVLNRLYGCLPDSKRNLLGDEKKSAASLYSTLFAVHLIAQACLLAPMHIR